MRVGISEWRGKEKGNGSNRSRVKESNGVLCCAVSGGKAVYNVK